MSHVHFQSFVQQEPHEYQYHHRLSIFTRSFHWQLAIIHFTLDLTFVNWQFALWMPLPPSITLDLIEEEFKPVFSSLPRKLVCSFNHASSGSGNGVSSGNVVPSCPFGSSLVEHVPVWAPQEIPAGHLDWLLSAEATTADKHTLTFDIFCSIAGLLSFPLGCEHIFTEVLYIYIYIRRKLYLYSGFPSQKNMNFKLFSPKSNS